MREAIGGTWLFNIVIFFVLLFTAYMALSINSSKAYAVKNEVLSIIERNQGFSTKGNDSTLVQIVDYLDSVGYRSVGSCSRKSDNTTKNIYWAGIARDGSFVENASNRNDMKICVKKIDIVDYDKINNKNEVPYESYYRIEVFYNMDLPVIGSLIRLSVRGDSARVDYPLGYND